MSDPMNDIVQTTKKGFDLEARLKNRGLRKATITLFLDEDKGVELGWARDIVDQFQNVTGRVREGIIGELDALGTDGTPAEIKKLEKKRDEMIAELTKTGLTVHMRAVPAIIQKDCRRKARETMGLTEKGIPDGLEEEYGLAHAAHLMTVMFQSVTDNESGAINTELTYEDAVALIGYLPDGQWNRLNEKMGEVQYTDAISQSIEGQEDFS